MSMKQSYFRLAIVSERLHRLFLEVIRQELNRLSVRDITSVQCLILYHLGIAGGKINIGEFSKRGYYLGANISYNLAKIVKNGYFQQIPDPDDKRSSYVKLSKKGAKLYETLEELFDNHEKELKESGIENLNLIEINHQLNNVENVLKGIKNG